MNLNTGGWASRALTPLLRIIRGATNATTPVVVISEPVNSETVALVNADIAIVAKGTGATLAQVPDGTVTGGDKRAQAATDWQKFRVAATQVASGFRSVIGGGDSNTASGSRSTIGGGTGNTASGLYSVVGGGDTNQATATSSSVGGGGSCIASGDRSTVAGGDGNTASSSRAFVGGGQSNTAQTNTHAAVCGGNNNTASGQYSFVGGGGANTASGTYATVIGGNNNLANSQYSFISSGYLGTTRSIVGYHVFVACAAPIQSSSGRTQSALLLLGRQTTDATSTVLTSDTNAASTTNQVILPNNSAYSFSGEVIAGRTGAGDTARWTINGAIKRGASAATTAMVGTPTVTMTHNDAGASGWIVAVTADTTNGGIKVEVTGAASTTIRWVCKINTTEMTF